MWNSSEDIKTCEERGEEDGPGARADISLQPMDNRKNLPSEKERVAETTFN